MIRISHIDQNPERVVLRVEGRLVDQWVPLLEETCLAYQRDATAPISLDLSGLMFASKSGITLLRRLQREGVQCDSWSPFLREALQQNSQPPIADGDRGESMSV